MGQRIGQYGWTPERIWGAIAVAIALSYGAAAWWAVFKGRMDFDDPLRPLQTKLAIGLTGLALFLALPILDFGAISARSQLARLNSGQVTAEQFDWTAMAFDFGKAGRRRLAEIEKTGPANQRELAKSALASQNRYDLSHETQIVERQVDIDKRVRLLSPDIQWTDDLRRRVSALGDCDEQSRCGLVRLTPDKLILLRLYGPGSVLTTSIVDLAVSPPGTGAIDVAAAVRIADTDTAEVRDFNFDKSKLEARDVTVRQLYVDGKPVGQAVRISR
jgi:hypothetical protein